MSSSTENTTIRPAGPGDADVLFGFIVALAEFEDLAGEVVGSAAALRDDLAGPRPACRALLAERGGREVGFALLFETYSTFHTARCLHLEDLFVVPAARGLGVGHALLRACADLATSTGCPRLQWNVLDWNEAAIGFYERLGARVLPDWRLCRVDGAALATLANSGGGR